MGIIVAGYPPTCLSLTDLLIAYRLAYRLPMQCDLVVCTFKKGSNQTETAAHASRCHMQTLSERENEIGREAGWYGIMLALLAMSTIFAIALFA